MIHPSSLHHFSFRAWATIVLLFCLNAVHGAPAADPDAGFSQANKLYEEGKFAEAAAAYGQLLQTGTSSEPVYFNRGNAYFKLGQLGRAIGSYRLAERLTPRDPDLRANLQFARTQARGGTAYHHDWWLRWLGALTINEWSWSAAAALWLVFGLLALGQWQPELGRRWRRTAIAAGLAAVFLGVCATAKFKHDFLNPTAVVIAGEVDVRNGPLDESQTAFKVRDGIELDILDRKDNWLQVLDPAQRLGWIRDDQVLIIAGSPPSPPKA